MLLTWLFALLFEFTVDYSGYAGESQSSAPSESGDVRSMDDGTPAPPPAKP